MILIDSNRPGAIWLRAMFRYYCRKHGSQMKKLSPNTYYAEGGSRLKAEFEYERASGTLLVAIINAIAKDEKKNRNKIVANTTKDFVKRLYKEKANVTI